MEPLEGINLNPARNVVIPPQIAQNPIAAIQYIIAAKNKRSLGKFDFNQRASGPLLKKRSAYLDPRVSGILPAIYARAIGHFDNMPITDSNVVMFNNAMAQEFYSNPGAANLGEVTFVPITKQDIINTMDLYRPGWRQNAAHAAQHYVVQSKTLFKPNIVTATGRLTNYRAPIDMVQNYANWDSTNPALKAKSDAWLTQQPTWVKNQIGLQPRMNQLAAAFQVTNGTGPFTGPNRGTSGVRKGGSRRIFREQNGRKIFKYSKRKDGTRFLNPNF